MAEAPVGIAAVPMVQIPLTAGEGNSTVKTQDVPKNSAVSSSENIDKSGVTGVYKNLGADIKNINGFDVLNFSMAPGTSLITNQETMSYMDGGLVTEAQLGDGGIWGGIKRGLAGSSVLQNMVSNPTTSVRKITLSPLLQGSVVQIDIKSGETWRFSDKSFIACTPNLTVSGNLNIFKNFRLIFVGENLVYTTVKADKGTEGTVWVSSFGGVVKHDMDMGTADTVPLFINNGCFLGMLDNNGVIDFWEDYVDVGTAHGLFSAMFTQLGWIMKIQDTNPPKHAGPVRCTVLTQSLNPHNFERYIANIAKQTTSSNTNVLTSGYGAGQGGVILGSAAVGTGVASTTSGWGFWGSQPTTSYRNGRSNEVSSNNVISNSSSSNNVVPNSGSSNNVVSNSGSSNWGSSNSSSSNWGSSNSSSSNSSNSDWGGGKRKTIKNPKKRNSRTYRKSRHI